MPTAPGAEILDRGILVRDTGGTARRMIGSMMDISERKRAERELRERADELLRLTSALERSNRDLDQFAYAASHDLKAPLRGISNLARGSRRSWVSPRRLRCGATWRSFAGASTAWRR